MTSIDLIPTAPDNPDEGDVAAPEPVDNQTEEPSAQSQTTNSPEEVQPETAKEQSEVQPAPKRGRGRPPGAKNKKTVKLEPVQTLPVVADEKTEEKTEPPVAETPPVLSPTTRKREYMRELSLRRQAERQAKVAHYTNLLDRSLGY